MNNRQLPKELVEEIQLVDQQTRSLYSYLEPHRLELARLRASQDPQDHIAADAFSLEIASTVLELSKIAQSTLSSLIRHMVWGSRLLGTAVREHYVTTILKK